MKVYALVVCWNGQHEWRVPDISGEPSEEDVCFTEQDFNDRFQHLVDTAWSSGNMYAMLEVEV